jgi:hypothetical protein
MRRLDHETGSELPGSFCVDQLINSLPGSHWTSLTTAPSEPGPRTEFDFVSPSIGPRSR